MYSVQPVWDSQDELLRTHLSSTVRVQRTPEGRVINLLVNEKSNMQVIGGPANYEEFSTSLVQLTLNFHDGRRVKVANHNFLNFDFRPT